MKIRRSPSPTVPGDLLNNATDVDGNPLTITAFSVAGQAGPFTVGTPFLISGVGTLTVNANGSYTFAPAATTTGAVPVITYTVSDGQGGSGHVDPGPERVRSERRSRRLQRIVRDR